MSATIIATPRGTIAFGEFGHVQIGPERYALVYDPSLAPSDGRPGQRLDLDAGELRFGVGCGLSEIGSMLAHLCWHGLRPKYLTELNLIERMPDGQWQCPCCRETFPAFCTEGSPFAVHLIGHGIAAADCCAASCSGTAVGGKGSTMSDPTPDVDQLQQPWRDAIADPAVWRRLEHHGRLLGSVPPTALLITLLDHWDQASAAAKGRALLAAMGFDPGTVGYLADTIVSEKLAST